MTKTLFTLERKFSDAPNFPNLVRISIIYTDVRRLHYTRVKKSHRIRRFTLQSESCYKAGKKVADSLKRPFTRRIYFGYEVSTFFSGFKVLLQ